VKLTLFVTPVDVTTSLLLKPRVLGSDGIAGRTPFADEEGSDVVVVGGVDWTVGGG
jgi:hypothetical protein